MSLNAAALLPATPSMSCPSSSQAAIRSRTKSASLADDTCSIVRPRGRGGRRWVRRRRRGHDGLQMKSWSMQISESSSSAVSAVEGASIGQGVERREERTSTVMRIWEAGARQSDLCHLPSCATIIHPNPFHAALLDDVASDLRLDPDLVAPPSPSASMMDPAQRRLAGTPQSRFHLRPVDPRFPHHAPQQYYNNNHCSLHNSIAIATIVVIATIVL
jgi:hypothetical protein